MCCIGRKWGLLFIFLFAFESNWLIVTGTIQENDVNSLNNNIDKYNHKKNAIPVHVSLPKDVTQAGANAWGQLLQRSTRNECFARTLDTVSIGMCGSLDDISQRWFAIGLTNCHLEVSGRQTFHCQSDSLSICVQQFDETAFLIYTQFLQEVTNICVYLHADRWSQSVSSAISDLLDSSGSVTRLMIQQLRAQTILLENQNASILLGSQMLAHQTRLNISLHNSIGGILHTIHGFEAEIENLGRYTTYIKTIHQAVWQQIGVILSIGYYCVALIAVWLITSTTYSANARWPMCAILLIGFLIEVQIFQQAPRVCEKQLQHPDSDSLVMSGHIGPFHPVDIRVFCTRCPPVSEQLNMSDTIINLTWRNFWNTWVWSPSAFGQFTQVGNKCTPTDTVSDCMHCGFEEIAMFVDIISPLMNERSNPMDHYMYRWIGTPTQAAHCVRMTGCALAAFIWIWCCLSYQDISASLFKEIRVINRNIKEISERLETIDNQKLRDKRYSFEKIKDSDILRRKFNTPRTEYHHMPDVFTQYTSSRDTALSSAYQSDPTNSLVRSQRLYTPTTAGRERLQLEMYQKTQNNLFDEDINQFDLQVSDLTKEQLGSSITKTSTPKTQSHTVITKRSVINELEKDIIMNNPSTKSHEKSVNSSSTTRKRRKTSKNDKKRRASTTSNSDSAQKKRKVEDLD